MLFLKSFLEEDFPLFQSDLPEEIRKKRHMRSRRENIQALHFPTSSTDFLRAREELGYEELFHFQYRGIAKKHALEEESLGASLMTTLDSDLMRELIGGLPFALTDKQKIVLFQILKDMEKPHAMMRLLQGDVGTGKTIVALLVAIHMILSHREKARIQVAFMVPTEILASQHFQNSENLLRHYGITSALLTGSIAPKEKESIKDQIRGGDVEILFGTHALIQDSVRFASLGFVIVDEQHRFGVEQRKALEHFFSGDEKNGFYPHRLNMSATPIPRTLALTLYGDQDISVLNEYPVGRKPIHTKIVKSQKREEVYRFIEELIRE